MAIYHFSQFKHELFWRYFKRLHVFLAQSDYCVSKWEILDIIDGGVNSVIRIHLEYRDFQVKMLMMHGICLSGWLRIHLNLRRLVMFLDIHFLILARSIPDLIMLLFGVTYINLLIMILIHVLIMHAMLNLTLHHLWTILMSWPYMIHHFF